MIQTKTFKIALIATGLLLGACGSDTTKSGPSVDLEFDAGTSSMTADSGVSDDAGDDQSDTGTAVNNQLPNGCAASGFEVASAAAERSTSSLSVIAQTAATDGKTDELFFVHRTSNPETGTIQLDDSGFDTCTNCLVVQTGCNSEGCLDTYMALAGSIEILEVTGSFRARLNDLRLEPVSVDETGGTTVLDGDAYCIDELELTAPIETDPCSDWADPSLIDQNCGEAPLTVTFNVSGFQAESEDFVYVRIDFGDGETYYSETDTITTHTYQAGDWDAEIEAVGYIAGSRVTLTTPEQIRAY